MKKSRLTCAFVVVALALGSCASVPAKRVDTVVRGASASDLDAELSEVTLSVLLSQSEVDGVAREVFPLALVQSGIADAKGYRRAEYSLWLREEEYTVGIDSYTGVLCVLKLRSKGDGAVLATTVVSDETKLNLRSSGYVYALLREALGSLRAAASKAPAK
jgi:hypothetical protein